MDFHGFHSHLQQTLNTHIAAGVGCLEEGYIYNMGYFTGMSEYHI